MGGFYDVVHRADYQVGAFLSFVGWRHTYLVGVSLFVVFVGGILYNKSIELMFLVSKKGRLKWIFQSRILRSSICG